MLVFAVLSYMFVVFCFVSVVLFGSASRMLCSMTLFCLLFLSGVDLPINASALELCYVFFVSLVFRLFLAP